MPDNNNNNKDKTIDELKAENDNLQHLVLEEKMCNIKTQIEALGETLNERTNSVERKQEVEFKNIKDTLHDIKLTGSSTLAQTTLTNSRVSKIENQNLPDKIDDLENNTKVIRFMHKYPTITIVFVVGAYLFTIKEIRDVVFQYVTELFEIFKYII